MASSSEHSAEMRVAGPRRSAIPRSPIATRRTRRDANEENVPLVDRKPRPPLASTEIDDMDDDEREVVSRPYPGVDDGFFNEKPNDNHHPSETDNTDVEMVPAASDPNGQDEEIPEMTPRAGPDGETDTDETDGSKKPGPGSDHPLVPNFRPDQHPPGRFPYAPGYGTDIEIGSIMPPDDVSLPDFNVYQHKKTLAQGMMDLALFSANANQLRYVLESYNRHPYYYPSLVLISISLIFQIGVGIGLIWNATYNVKDEKQICLANRINNFTVIGIFLVTVVNVFISAFGVADMTPNVVTQVTSIVPVATPGAG